MYRYGPHHHHPVLGIILLVLFAALVVLAVLAVVRLWRTGPGPGRSRTPGATTGPATGSATDPALTELRLRYARGELAHDEYFRRVAGLGYQLPPGAGPVTPSAAPPTPPPAV